MVAAGLAAVLGLIVPIAGCDSGSPTSGVTPTSPSATPAPLTLFGQVFELTPGRRVPTADFPVTTVVEPSGGGRWTYERTTTGPDGRYHFPNLPAGSAFVLAYTTTHRQVCGAVARLGAATELEVEITSRANPQPSTTMPSLRVTGQVYQTTPSERAGVGGTFIYLEHDAPDAPFLEVYADADGHYTTCGIPTNTRIGFFRPPKAGTWIRISGANSTLTPRSTSN
jgi:hypothetical protein